MIISSFWANDLDYILIFFFSRIGCVIVGTLLVFIGSLEFVTLCLDHTQVTSNKYSKYALYGLSILIPFGIIVISIYGFNWAYENHTPQWIYRSRSRYYPPDAFSAGWTMVISIGFLSVLISNFVSFIIKKVKQQKIGKKELKGNPYLKLSRKGIYSIARITKLEEISPHSYWITYEFIWQNTNYRNKIARYKTKRNGAFDLYELDALLFVQFMKKDPSNNMLTDQLVPNTKKLKLAIEDVPQSGWKRNDYLRFINQ